MTRMEWRRRTTTIEDLVAIKEREKDVTARTQKQLLQRDKDDAMVAAKTTSDVVTIRNSVLEAVTFRLTNDDDNILEDDDGDDVDVDDGEIDHDLLAYKQDVTREEPLLSERLKIDDDW